MLNVRHFIWFDLKCRRIYDRRKKKGGDKKAKMKQAYTSYERMEVYRGPQHYDRAENEFSPHVWHDERWQAHCDGEVSRQRDTRTM